MQIIQTRKVIADKLGITEKTLRRRLRKLNIPDRVHVSPIDLELIAVKYGTREKLKEATERFR